MWHLIVLCCFVCSLLFFLVFLRCFGGVSEVFWWVGEDCEF